MCNHNIFTNTEIFIFYLFKISCITYPKKFSFLCFSRWRMSLNTGDSRKIFFPKIKCWTKVEHNWRLNSMRLQGIYFPNTRSSFLSTPSVLTRSILCISHYCLFMGVNCFTIIVGVVNFPWYQIWYIAFNDKCRFWTFALTI